MVNPDNKVNYDPSDESNYVVEDGDVRPVTAPQPTNKDFKKVMGKMRKEGKEGEGGKKKSPGEVTGDDVAPFAAVAEKGSKDEEEMATAEVQAPVSLFDLSKGSTPKEDTKPVAKLPAPVHHATVESPSDLFKRMATKETKSIKEEHLEESDARNAAISTAAPTKKDKFTTRYTPEQTDLSSVNPLAANMAAQPTTNIISETKAVERATPLTPAMKELVEQIVKSMYTIEKKGQTDTIITLQYPPQFKDVHLVVTSYDSARGQFNIAFENLTQAAKNILDQENNRKALIAALDEKGYGVQIVQTTTLIEHNVPVMDESRSRQGRDQQRGDEEQSDERKRRDRG